MAPAPSRIVIVGASLGGASAAVGLAERRFGGEVLIGESSTCLQRPPLSKALMLVSGMSRTGPEADYYATHDIGLLTGTVATARSIGNAGWSPRAAMSIRTTSCCSPRDHHRRRLGTPGVDLDGVVTLRTWDDALGAAQAVRRGCEGRRRRGRLDRLRGGSSRPSSRCLGDCGGTAVPAARVPSGGGNEVVLSPICTGSMVSTSGWARRHRRPRRRRDLASVQLHDGSLLRPRRW